MAMQTPAPTQPSAQVVGNAFVEQYYKILHHSPEFAFRFYQDSSVLSRPDPDGVMTSVTTMKGINDKICSLDYKNYKAEIKTADAQDSHKDGVIIMVTGFLTGKDNLRRKFAQSFFLAPQDIGYYVLNDVFRYLEESEPMEIKQEAVNGGDGIPSATPTSDPETSHVLDPPVMDQAIPHAKEVQDVEEQTVDLFDNDESPLEKEMAAVNAEPQLNENNVSAVSESAPSDALDDAPKKSYASIVSSQARKGNLGASKVYVPTSNSRVASMKTEKFSVSSVAKDPPAATSAPNAPSSINATESIDAQDEGESHSIYIRNLPLNVTADQLEAEFKKFGLIKQGGVQVRSNKIQGFCFGFVEFQDPKSIHNAIQASPVKIGDRQADVKIKRTANRVGSTTRGHFSSGRGGFRNDNFRGRGNYSGGRGFGRNNFGSRSDFSGRGRGPGGRGGEGYQQGRGRGGRQGGHSQNAMST